MLDFIPISQGPKSHGSLVPLGKKVQWTTHLYDSTGP